MECSLVTCCNDETPNKENILLANFESQLTLSIDHIEVYLNLIFGLDRKTIRWKELMEISRIIGRESDRICT